MLNFTPTINITPENLFIIIFMAIISIVCIFSAIAIKIMNKQNNVLVKESDFISDFLHKTEKALRQRKSTLSLGAFFGLSGICALLLCVILYIFSGELLVGCIGFVGVIIPYLIVDLMAQANTPKFEKSYSKSLNLLSSDLRVNSSIPQAIYNVSNSPFLDESMARSYSKMYSGLQLGKDIESVFNEFAEMNDSLDAYDVASAISIQTKVGGDISRVLEDISGSINTRMEERKKIKSMLTETMVMIWMFDIVPIFVMFFMIVLMKDAYKVYFESVTGGAILLAIIVMQIIGGVVARMISKKAQNV